MLPSAIDKALNLFSVLRAKVDEVVSSATMRRIRSLWTPFRRSSKLFRELRIGGIDSGYNYVEYRGYALYVLNACWVVVEYGRGEETGGDADIDIVSTSSIEFELSTLSIAMELQLARNVVNRCDALLIDGSLVAKYFTLLRAKEYPSELLASKNISVTETLKELAYISTLFAGKVFFLAKNSNARDVLNLVKGDIYYFERYTDGEPGYSKPIDLAHSSQGGTASIARSLELFIKDVVGLPGKVFVSYVRFSPYSRVYRLEFVAENREEAEERVRSFLEMVEPFTVAGYPYPLARADQLARVGYHDVESIANVLGIALDPWAREGLEVLTR